MKKKNIRNLRTILTINFVAEILGIIVLYLSTIHSVKIFNINILNFLFFVISILGLLLILKVIKKNKTETIVVLSSLCLLLFSLIFNLMGKISVISPYLQVFSDGLKLFLILNIFKNLKLKKYLSKKIVIITMVSYIISKVSFIILSLSNGLTFRPIMTTISIIGIVIVYTLYIKCLEKR